LKKTNPGSSSKASSFDREQYLYVTTRGRKSGRSHEIEIWFTERSGRFYIIAEYGTANWLRNLQVTPEVTVRVAGESFAARARVISSENEAELFRSVQELSQRKYGWGDGTIVELEPSERK
jgi:deazaflavin-dependent oxidoreductase (nitroreductase family)